MVEIFADGADLNSIIQLSTNPIVKGFTTNPALLRKAGVRDYRGFIRDVLSVVDGKPVSFEVFSDDFDEMYAQAMSIRSFGDNVYVKIPITSTDGGSTYPLVHNLIKQGVGVNVTALMTVQQVEHIYPALCASNTDSFISVFAGRIADTGIDPVLTIKGALDVIKSPYIRLIWASPREVYNIYQAEGVRCHVITCPPDIIKKYESLKGINLDVFSRETVQMFYDDAINSGLKL